MYYMKVLSKSIENQVETFIHDLETYNKKLPNPRNPKNYIYLQDFFIRHLRDTNARALEVEDNTYQKIRDHANTLFPVTTLWNLCIDGRVLSILAHGASAGIGSSIRVPGGILREFVRGTDGKLHLKEDSDFATFLSKAFISFDSECVAEIFDSHVGCAARLGEELMKGRDPKDSGLLADISHKMQMVQATKEFVAKKFGEKKRVLAIMTSFDPHSGFLYMGLETKDALGYVRARDKAYTKKMLADLVFNAKIISTEHLVQDQKVRELFEKNAFKLAWKKAYVQSARQFWNVVEHLKKELLPSIKKQLISIYPHLSSSSRFSQEELEERAILILTNALSGFLNNNYSSESTQTKGEEHNYPYSSHNEEGVQVSEGGYPPYEVSLFTVFGYEEENLPANVELCVSLVRKNRKEGRVVDNNSIFSNEQSFVEASVPIIVQEIVREEVSEEGWKELSAISWQDLPSNWDTMEEDAFFSYLQEKGIKEFAVGVGINNLRKRMAGLYFLYHSTSSRLIEHYSIALPVIADQYRMNHFVMPFIKLGFENI